MKKPSLIQRLTGNVSYDDEYDDDFFDDEHHTAQERSDIRKVANAGVEAPRMWGDEADVADDELDGGGDLPIDMYETDNAIIINTLVAGVDPNELDIAITRDTVTISGSRYMQEQIMEDDFIARELYWGTFSRTISLPDEVVIDEAEAHGRHGFLQIILPKFNKTRSARLRVKSTSK